MKENKKAPKNKYNTALSQIKKGVRGFSRILAYVSMFLLLPMMFLTTADVTLRKLFATTIPGTMELSSYMLSLFTLLGLSYTYQQGKHIHISIFIERLPQNLQQILALLLNMLLLIVLSLLIKSGWETALRETSVSDMLRIRQTPFRLVIVLAFCSLALEIIVNCGENIICLLLQKREQWNQ